MTNHRSLTHRWRTMGNTEPEILEALVRMVIPLRREFRMALDVNRFLVDRPYAVEVLQAAKRSADQMVRDRATFVENRHFGARQTRAPAASPQTVTGSPPSAASGDETRLTDKELAHLRDRALNKYKGGLR